MSCPQYIIRAATSVDLPALTQIKAPEALHRDRLRDASDEGMLYLLIEHPHAVVGFGLLVFKRPPTWPDADDRSRLPAIVDLLVVPECRGRGAGSVLIEAMEEIAFSRGYTCLYLGVDPVDNPMAYRLYLRLGFVPLQDTPYRSHWRFTDSEGNVHEGDEWSVDMMKDLRAGH